MAPSLAHRGRPDRAFERIYQRHAPDVYRYSLAVLRDPDDAEDVTQTTFLNAYRAFEGGERPRNAQAWLITIAHNVCRQRFRQAQRRPSEVILDEGAHAAPPRDDDTPSLEDVQRALGELPFNQRSALVMRELEGRSYKEIAATLELTVPAVETLLFRARRALREQLEESLTCHDAEIAISKQLDGRLPRGERGGLRAHLRVCEDCARSARRVRAQRTALKGLGALPLPASLSSFFGGGTAAATGGAGVAIFGSGIVVKVAAVAAGAAVVAGAGVEGARHLPTAHGGKAEARRAVAAPDAPAHGVASVAQRGTNALAVLALPRRADARQATPSRPAKAAKETVKAVKAVAKAARKASRAVGLEPKAADKPTKTRSKRAKSSRRVKAARREAAAPKANGKADEELPPGAVVVDKPKAKDDRKGDKAREADPQPEGGTPVPAPEEERPKAGHPKLPIELPAVPPVPPITLPK